MPKNGATPKPRKAKGKRHTALSRPVSSLFDYKFSMRDAGGLITDVAKAVASVWNTEDKYISIAGTTTVVDYNGVLGTLNTIAEGDDYNNRNGRSIKAVSLYFAYRAAQHASKATGTVVRIMLIRDHAMQGATPSYADVLGGASGSAAAVLPPITVNNEQRFELLTDQRFVLSAYGNDGDVVNGVFACKLNAHMLYLGTGATAADCGLGSVHMLMVTDSAANLPTIDYNSRIRFVDN